MRLKWDPKTTEPEVREIMRTLAEEYPFEEGAPVVVAPAPAVNYYAPRPYYGPRPAPYYYGPRPAPPPHHHAPAPHHGNGYLR